MATPTELELFICVRDGDDIEPQSSQSTGSPMKSIGLPVVSRVAMDMLLNAAARIGGQLGIGPTSAAFELRNLGLVGPRLGLTRRGAALTHLLQCAYYEGDTACVGCSNARHKLAARR